MMRGGEFSPPPQPDIDVTFGADSGIPSRLVPAVMAGLAGGAEAASEVPSALPVWQEDGEWNLF